MTATIIHGDCLDVLRGMADASVDAVVTDPPYELAFMGRKWDASGVAYSVDLWREVLQRDTWLKILGRFVHLQVEEKEDWEGRKFKNETLIFPRYHQWDLVTLLVDTAAVEGPGHCYLAQHSAGSGKSNSIAWAAHQLSSLFDPAGGKMFHSVIVITDRTVLDSQLQDTIAFTATPKPRTLELFGRRPDPSRPPAKDNLPQAFHVYSMRKAFDTGDYQVMIAANKFQTGFDQPKLCAMHVLKRLSGVDCVQTLSRLNRTYPGKEESGTFILDFVNDPQEVLASFLPYHKTAAPSISSRKTSEPSRDSTSSSRRSSISTTRTWKSSTSTPATFTRCCATRIWRTTHRTSATSSSPTTASRNNASRT